MAKPLSQDEIDILLEVRNEITEAEDYDINALESMMAADMDKRVTPYNFKRPRLFSQDQMRVLNYVHESFARDLSVYLSAQLRTIVDITLTAVDQVLYSEYVMSSAPPSAIYVIRAVNLDHRMIFEIDPRLVLYTIEKLFGGPGVFPKQAREVSQIEQRIMSKVMARAFRELEKSWHQVNEIKLEQDVFETNAEFVQIIPAVEPALVATFEVTVYDQRSYINICYPYLLLEKMLGRAGMKKWISSATSQVPPEIRDRYEDQLRSMNVELRAELGAARLSVRDIMQLEEGDVIPLDRRVNEPIMVYFDEKEKFKAVAGRSEKRRALRILEVIESKLIPEEDE